MPIIPARRWRTCRPFASVSGASQGLKLAFVGDGNNVAHSLMLTSLRLGMDFALACPEGYLPNPDIVAQAEGLAAVSGAPLTITHEPRRRSQARTRCIRTCGPAWGRSRKRLCAARHSTTTR